ncbi:DoxX family protein [Flavobacterium sp. NRK1]|uniref:DoxX family protein n=1 Tax=Flavobacterium sp. NRK1 TaxID=2954929 RepID=UPI0020939A28|nr:DoxX family protein [Flavobacterium sp. NRK1]MCO6148060.1 DoxX family protein [Flavobacterium sp. NRK1]
MYSTYFHIANVTTFVYTNNKKSKKMKYTLLAGRVLYSLIFIFSSFGHFSEPSIGYAASKGVPAASLLVPLSGIIELIGALSILLGYKAKYGAWLIVLFLIPVTFMLHNFWTIEDAMAKQMDMAAFMKNISMMGAALMIAYFGSGPLSLDNRKNETAL